MTIGPAVDIYMYSTVQYNIIMLLFRFVELTAKMDHSTDYWPSCSNVQYNNHTPV
jgi:hypothetical protein